MDIAILIIALLLKLAGFFFLLGAGLGLLRFQDPLLRMHAATKSGTIGAGFMVGGAALPSGDATTLIVAALTIVFLILTVPLAGHLLGRAVYFSGTPLVGLDKRDALAEQPGQGQRTTDTPV